MGHLINPYRFGGGAPPPTGYAAEVLADSPLVYWKVDETSGSVAADASGNSRPGTITAVTLNQASLLTDGSGKSGLWPGNNTTPGHIEHASATWMNQTAFTVEAIIHPTNASGSFLIASRDDLAFAGVPSNRAWLFRINSGRLNASVNAAGEQNISGAGTIVANNTYRVAMVFTGTQLIGYINGVQQTVVSYTTTPGAKTSPLRLGHHMSPTGSNVWNFAGRIDEFAFYGSALSSGRLAAHNAAA